jgi:hypothetical protein
MHRKAIMNMHQDTLWSRTRHAKLQIGVSWPVRTLRLCKYASTSTSCFPTVHKTWYGTALLTPPVDLCCRPLWCSRTSSKVLGKYSVTIPGHPSSMMHMPYT